MKKSTGERNNVLDVCTFGVQCKEYWIPVRSILKESGSIRSVTTRGIPNSHPSGAQIFKKVFTIMY